MFPLMVLDRALNSCVRWKLNVFWAIELLAKRYNHLCCIEIKCILDHRIISKSLFPFMYYNINKLVSLSLKFAVWN